MKTPFDFRLGFLFAHNFRGFVNLSGNLSRFMQLLFEIEHTQNGQIK